MKRANAFALCLIAAWAKPAMTGDLKYAVIVARHGVRAPTWTARQLNEYSAQPWPKWDVLPGELTAHGRQLMQLFGTYYRMDFARQGLLAPAGCADAKQVFFWADTDQRTLESGKALAEGMLPGCGVKTGSAAEDEADPLFNPLAFSIGKPSGAMALASVAGRVGGNAGDLLDLHRPALQELQRILAGDGKAAKSLLDAPVSIVAGKGDRLVEITGAVRTASTLAENLLLEYTDGRRGPELGWGRLEAGNLRQIMPLHTAYADLARRTPYLARVRGSNLLFHVLASLEQAASGTRVQGAMGAPDDRVLVLTGHDTNLSNLSGMLGLNWLLSGYQQDDTPPGGALVFEMRGGGPEPLRVRTYYTAQSLEQMRDAAALSMESPPLRGPVFLPGCSQATAGFDCSWSDFRKTVEAAMDREFVKP